VKSSAKGKPEGGGGEDRAPGVHPYAHALGEFLISGALLGAAYYAVMSLSLALAPTLWPGRIAEAMCSLHPGGEACTWRRTQAALPWAWGACGLLAVLGAYPYRRALSRWWPRARVLWITGYEAWALLAGAYVAHALYQAFRLLYGAP
jgi:hypothetical protein